MKDLRTRMFLKATHFPHFVSLLPALGVALCLLSGCAGGAENAHKPLVNSTFESDPPGATLFVEGSFAGTTPMEYQLPAQARVEVRVTRPGYKTHTEVLTRKAPPSAPVGEGWEAVYYFSLDPDTGQ
jgi:hypothetical protein